MTFYLFKCAIYKVRQVKYVQIGETFDNNDWTKPIYTIFSPNEPNNMHLRYTNFILFKKEIFIPT